MDTYRGVALGVESAWPAFLDGYVEKGVTNMRSKIFGVLGIALAVAGLALLAGCGKPQAQPAAPPLEVSVIEVSSAPVAVYNEYVAQTQAPDTIEIRAQVTGLLERQAFADGARVKKGDLLYVIDPRPVRGPGRASQGGPGPGRGEPGQRQAEPGAQRAPDRAEGGEPAGLRHRVRAGARGHGAGRSAKGAACAMPSSTSSSPPCARRATAS